MFGYVRPSDGHLTAEDKQRFQAAYCGLCRSLGRRYGLAARMILNYDLAFLAMLLSREPECPTAHCRCPAHPIRGCDALERQPAFGGGYRTARARRPGFDERTRTHLEELARLEGERCPSMDRAADAFAVLLAGAAEEEPDPVRRRVLEQLLYHLGRWIYLVDAADDLKKDVKSGSYNPLVYRFHAEGGTLTAEDRAALAATLDSSVRAMAAAFELADFGPWRAIIESVVYEGLYAVGAAVLNGTFRKGRRRKQRKAGA